MRTRDVGGGNGCSRRQCFWWNQAHASASPLAGEPYRLELPDITVIAGKKRPKAGPELAFGLVPSDTDLVDAARWGVSQIISATSRGHFGVEADSGMVSPVASDAYGVAMLALAKRLTQGRPSALLVQRHRPCAWCGKEITYQRSTRRFCSSACQRAVMRTRQRTRQESAP